MYKLTLRWSLSCLSNIALMSYCVLFFIITFLVLISASTCSEYLHKYTCWTSTCRIRHDHGRHVLSIYRYSIDRGRDTNLFYWCFFLSCLLKNCFNVVLCSFIRTFLVPVSVGSCINDCVYRQHARSGMTAKDMLCPYNNIPIFIDRGRYTNSLFNRFSSRFQRSPSVPATLVGILAYVSTMSMATHVFVLHSGLVSTAKCVSI